MLILGRKVDQRILIGDDVVLTIVRVKGNFVHIGLDAPKSVKITRAELLPDRILQEAKESRIES